LYSYNRSLSQTVYMGVIVSVDSNLTKRNAYDVYLLGIEVKNID